MRRSSRELAGRIGRPGLVLDTGKIPVGSFDILPGGRVEHPDLVLDT